MKNMKVFPPLFLLMAASAGADTIKVGVIAPFPGPFAQYGIQFQQAIEVYQARQGMTAGRCWPRSA